MSIGEQISREYHCGKKHWLDKSFLQILKCLKVTGWLAKRKLILSDHMSRNQDLSLIWCCRLLVHTTLWEFCSWSWAGSHLPVWLLTLPQASAALLWKWDIAVEGSRNNLSMWVQQTHFPLGPPSPGSLWELLWFLGRGTPAVPLGEEQVWRGSHQLWAHTAPKLFSSGFWSHSVENSQNSGLTGVSNFP